MSLKGNYEKPERERNRNPNREVWESPTTARQGLAGEDVNLYEMMGSKSAKTERS